MEWRREEQSKWLVQRSCKTLSQHCPRVAAGDPLGLPNDDAQIISNPRVFERLAEARSEGVQPPAPEGMPAASPRRCGRAAMVGRELPGRLHLVRIGALAAAYFAHLQGPGEQTCPACRRLRQGRRVGS